MKLRKLNFIGMLICFYIFTATQSSYAQVKTDSIKTATIKVSGITCGMDLKIINNNVQKLNGVVSSESISKAAPTTTFEVKYKPSVIALDSIYKVVENSPSCDFPDQKPYKVRKGK